MYSPVFQFYYGHNSIKMTISGVRCDNIPEHPYYRCGMCPEGMTGNGTRCHDIDEVSQKMRKLMGSIRRHIMAHLANSVNIY